MNNKRQRELVDLIFEKQYRCSASPMMLDAAIPMPVQDHNSVTNSTCGNVVHTVTNSNEHHVLEAMFGHTRYTSDENTNREIGKTNIDVSITIAHMAEIIAIGGKFTLSNYRESTEIADTLDEYATFIFDAKRMEPHFKSPPEEDLEKLNDLLNAIRPLSNRVMSVRQGTGIWAEIDALFTATGVYEIGKDTDDFFAAKSLPTNNATPSVRVDHRKLQRDPYKF